MQITFNANEKLQEIIYHWFAELKQRVYNRGIDFNSDDLVAIKDGGYIIVMANVTLTDYDNDGKAFERKNVTIKYRELIPESNYWSDDGRFLISTGSSLSLSVELFPIYLPELIVLLNEDGSLFKDGLDSKSTLEKMVAQNEIEHWESRLDAMLKILENDGQD